jgi:hypothetical protein
LGISSIPLLYIAEISPQKVIWYFLCLAGRDKFNNFSCFFLPDQSLQFQFKCWTFLVLHIFVDAGISPNYKLH